MEELYHTTLHNVNSNTNHKSGSNGINQQLNKPKPMAVKLWGWGANVLPLYSGEKIPRIKWGEWKTTRQTEDDINQFRWDYAGGVSIVVGINGWRTIDIDAILDSEGNKKPVPSIVVDLILEAMGLPHDYQWVWQSGAKAGWGIAVICNDEILHDSLKDKGCLWFEPTEEGVGDFGHIEVRLKDHSTVLPPSIYENGQPYQWRYNPPSSAPTEVKGITIYDAIIGADTQPQANALKATKSTPTAVGDGKADEGANIEDSPLKREIRLAFDMVSYATNKLGTTSQNEDGGQVRIRSQGGLLITPTEGKWYSFRDGVGGDCFDLVGWLEIGLSWFDDKRANWGRVVGIAADFAGVDIPTEGFSAGMHPPYVNYDFVVKCLNNDERGDADLLAHIADGRAVFDGDEKEFFLFNGQRFEGGGDAVLRLIISGVLPSIYLSASKQAREKQTDLQKQIDAIKARDEQPPADLLDALSKEKKTGDRLVYRARGMRKRKGVNNTLFFFESLTVKTGDYWDKDKDLLGVENGVVDLCTGKLRNGRPSDYIRTFAPTIWKGLDEPAPRFEQFMLEIMGDDKPTAQYLSRLLGYAISGHTNEHKLPFFIGENGSNGKSMLFNALRMALGDSNTGYVKILQKEVILQSRANAGGASPHIHMMRGGRLGLLSETNEGERLDLGQMKQLTGGDAITSRKLHGNPVTWENQCQLFLITNHLPHGDADDEATWRRLTTIPFSQQFVDNPNPELNQCLKDANLNTKLKAEVSGILAFLVRAGIRWRAGGLGESETVKQLVRDYRVNEDTLGMFSEECIVTSSNAEPMAASDLYTTYEAWAKGSGIKPMSRIAFGRKMGKRFDKAKQSGVVVYLDIKLKARGRDILLNAEGNQSRRGGQLTITEENQNTSVSTPPTAELGRTSTTTSIPSSAPHNNHLPNYSQQIDEHLGWDDGKVPNPPTDFGFIPPIIDDY